MRPDGGFRDGGTYTIVLTYQQHRALLRAAEDDFVTPDQLIQEFVRDGLRERAARLATSYYATRRGA